MKHVLIRRKIGCRVQAERRFAAQNQMGRTRSAQTVGSEIGE